jgi:hypothetical protein
MRSMRRSGMRAGKREWWWRKRAIMRRSWR